MYDERKSLMKETQQAKITVEVGDYRVTMNGQLEPPQNHQISLNDYDEHGDYLTDHNMDRFFINDVRRYVIMKLGKPENIKVERFKWSIPVQRKPWVEDYA